MGTLQQTPTMRFSQLNLTLASSFRWHCIVDVGLACPPTASFVGISSQPGCSGLGWLYCVKNPAQVVPRAGRGGRLSRQMGRQMYNAT